MTLKNLYEYALVEQNKVQAANMLLEDFNLFVNKAVQQYINRQYNLYDTTLQVTDGLRVLLTSAVLSMDEQTNCVTFPSDYLHLLNCSCTFSVNNKKCGGSKLIKYPATKLTADVAKQIETNYYFTPSYKHPYYYLTQAAPTFSSLDGSDSDLNTPSPIISFLDLALQSYSQPITDRTSNPYVVNCEIRYGEGQGVKLVSIEIDYLRSPQHLCLTLDLLDTILDYSQRLEFPDYICYEILNELTILLMEHNSDPRLQTRIPISLSIVSTAQALTLPAQ